MAYIAPELLLNNQNDHTVDYWSLGVIIYQMMKGTLPFYNRDKIKMLKNITT